MNIDEALFLAGYLGREVDIVLADEVRRLRIEVDRMGCGQDSKPQKMTPAVTTPEVPPS